MRVAAFRLPFLALCVAAVALVPASRRAAAQQLGVAQAQILTISAERLFSESRFGRRVAAEIEAESAVLAAENERIIAGLSREEAELTEQRETMEPEAFRLLADAFDTRVQEHRANQKAKLEELSTRNEQARQQFFEVAQPILEQIMRETGAGVILERSSVFLSANATDITNIAVSRIDAAIGDGADIEDTGQR